MNTSLSWGMITRFELVDSGVLYHINTSGVTWQVLIDEDIGYYFTGSVVIDFNYDGRGPNMYVAGRTYELTTDPLCPDCL